MVSAYDTNVLTLYVTHSCFRIKIYNKAEIDHVLRFIDMLHIICNVFVLSNLACLKILNHEKIFNDIRSSNSDVHSL